MKLSNFWLMKNFLMTVIWPCIVEESDSKLRELDILSQKEIELQKVVLFKEREEREI